MKPIQEYIAQAKSSFFGDEAPLEFFARRKNIIVGAAAVWIVASGGLYAYGTLAGRQEPDAQKEAAALVAQVGKLILLPDNEEPVIATVNDPEQLKSQPFFANAKEGDKVLIYNISRKAILYSPTDKRIIEVAPLSQSAAQ
jgi:hypothetical protein